MGWLRDLFRKKEVSPTQRTANTGHRTKYERALGELDFAKRAYQEWPCDSTEYGLKCLSEFRSCFYAANTRLRELYEEGHDEAIELNKQYNALVSKVNRDIKAVYDFETKKLGMHKKSGKLEKAAATAAIIGLIGGIFFFSANLTGNVIGINNSTSNVVGSLFLILGILGLFFYLRKR